MGNSDSHCCDLSKGDGDKSTVNEDCKGTPRKKLSCDGDPRSPSADIYRTPVNTFLSAPPHIVAAANSSEDFSDVLDDDLHAPSRKQKSSCSLEPLNEASLQTPLCGTNSYKQVLLETALLDPRSPSNGIARTPLCLPQNKVTEGIIDPRSPTCGVTRTPIVTLESPNDTSDALPCDLHDPRSPTAELPRTPIKLSYKGNLRRTVLLSNTLTSSPINSKPNDGKQNNPGAVHQKEIEQIELKPSNLLELSCASNLNVSITSSMAANIGSDCASINTDDLSDSFKPEDGDQYEQGLIIEDVVEEMVMVACKTNTQSHHDGDSCTISLKGPVDQQPVMIETEENQNLLCEEFIEDAANENPDAPETWQSENDDFISCSNIDNQESTITEDVPKPMKIVEDQSVKKSSEDVGITSKADIDLASLNEYGNVKQKSQIPSITQPAVLRKRHTLSSGHQKSLSVGAESLISFTTINDDKATESASSLKAQTSQNSRIAKPQQKFKGIVKQHPSKSSTRSPLAVLGHSNSPEPKAYAREGRSLENRNIKQNLKKSASRVPRYRGTPVSRSRSVSLASSGYKVHNLSVDAGMHRNASMQNKEN